MTVRELIQELLRCEMDDEVNAEVVDADSSDIYDVKFDYVTKTPVLVIK